MTCCSWGKNRTWPNSSMRSKEVYVPVVMWRMTFSVDFPGNLTTRWKISNFVADVFLDGVHLQRRREMYRADKGEHGTFAKIFTRFHATKKSSLPLRAKTSTFPSQGIGVLPRAMLSSPHQPGISSTTRRAFRATASLHSLTRLLPYVKIFLREIESSPVLRNTGRRPTPRDQRSRSARCIFRYVSG